MHVTVEILAAAFQAWEDDFRQDPSAFLNPAEVASLTSEDLSNRQAAHLMALLKQQA